MSLSKLTRQLRREVITNPKKAAILGLLVVVALWFWAPLVWGWIAEEEPAAETAAGEPAATSPPASPTNSPAQSDRQHQKAQSPQHPWQQLVKWINNDPRTSPAAPLPERRDPFLTPKSMVAEDGSGKAPSDVTPQSLGMVLTTTIIGPRRRVARINGKSYQQGNTVKLDKDGQQIEFTLLEVHPRRIVLNRGEKRFELRISSSAHSGRIRLFGSTN